MCTVCRLLCCLSRQRAYGLLYGSVGNVFVRSRVKAEGELGNACEEFLVLVKKRHRTNYVEFYSLGSI